MRRRPDVFLLLPLAVAAVTSAVAWAHPEWALAGADLAPLVLRIAAGVAIGAAAAALASPGRDRRPGALLCGVAATWLVVGWENPGAPAIVFTLGMVLADTAPAVLAHWLLADARGRLRSTRDRVVVGGAYAGLAGLAGAGATVVTDPVAGGCASCPPNLLLIVDTPALERALETAGMALGAASLVAAGLLAAWHMVGASAVARGVLLPVVLPGIAVLGFAAAQHVQNLRRGWEGAAVADDSVATAQAAALLGVALGVAWRRLAARRLRGRLAALVVEMADGARPRPLRDLLAGALGDPTLELLYAFGGGWVDAAGRARRVPRADAHEVTSLVQDGEVVAVVMHRRGLFHDARLLHELGRTARLAIDHERLQAHQYAQLGRLSAARTATVAAADDERRRLERDLHDGAQQALAGLAMALGLARTAHTGEEAFRLRRAQDDVRAALEEVRTMAHATYPAALDEAGLAAALDVLSDWRPQLELGAIPDERLDPCLESSLYFVAALLTPAGGGCRLDVVIDRQHAQVALDAQTTVLGELHEVEDRVRALGGRLVVTHQAAGAAHVRVEIPCA